MTDEFRLQAVPVQRGVTAIPMLTIRFSPDCEPVLAI
jgi:hypothetical protein